MTISMVAIAVATIGLAMGCGSREPEVEREVPAPVRERASSSSEGERASSSERERAEREVPAEDVPLVRGSRSMMSTVYQITVVSSDEARAREAIEAALDEVERLGVVLSEWREDSEVSAINRAAGREPVRVGADTMANIQMSLQIAEWTDGAYDITWAALRGFYLFQPGEARVPDMERVRERLPLINWRDVIVDPEASTVMLRREGQSIGLGGIAKGWAVDRAGAILLERGLRDFMIFGGGQVLVHGRRGDRGWRVGVQHPRASSYIGFVEATDASIATSGDYEHFFIDEEGTRWHHIIDLSTGLPARGAVSVTIIAPTGLLADGLDTGCFVMGAERCLEMLANIEPRVEAVIIDSDFRLHFTPGTQEHFILRTDLDGEGRIPH